MSSKTYNSWPFLTKSPSLNPIFVRSAEILEVMSTDEIGTTLPVYLYSASSYSVVASQTGTEILGAPASEGGGCGAAERGETRNAAIEICKAIFLMDCFIRVLFRDLFEESAIGLRGR